MTQKLESSIYSQEGKEVGKISLPENIFGVAWNADLVHEVVVSMQSNERAGTAHTKTRGEVRGGGKKPWKQKGTGRARHGSTRSPIWSGGGVAHGPRNDKDFTKKINKNVRAKALATILSKKFIDGEMFFIDALTFAAPKTSEAKQVLSSLGTISGAEGIVKKQKNSALIVLSGRDENTEKSFRNFGNIMVSQAKDVSPVALLTYKYVVVAKPSVALETFGKRVATRAVRGAAKADKVTTTRR